MLCSGSSPKAPMDLQHSGGKRRTDTSGGGKAESDPFWSYPRTGLQAPERVPVPHGRLPASPADPQRWRRRPARTPHRDGGERPARPTAGSRSTDFSLG